MICETYLFTDKHISILLCADPYAITFPQDFQVYLLLCGISKHSGPLLYKSNRMANLESVLSSSIAPVFFTAFIESSVIWYGSVSAALELFGPNRYHWDNGYFSQDIEGRVSSVNSMLLNKAWEQMPDKLVLYDYIGHNPSKAGLFRSGPILKGDGLVHDILINYDI